MAIADRLRRHLAVGLIAGLACIALPVMAAEHGGGKGKDGKDGKEAGAVQLSPPYFFDLPSMLINLNSVTKRQVFLKVLLTVEVAEPGDIDTVKHVMPSVLDGVQFYLREKKAEELVGSAGMYRLRQDLMARIAMRAYPAKVKDVLFKELLIQ